MLGLLLCLALSILVTKTVRLFKSLLASEKNEDVPPPDTLHPLEITNIRAPGHESFRQSISVHSCWENSWLNATLQAISNVEVVNQKLRDLPPTSLAKKSLMPPKFAKAFSTALHNPTWNMCSQELQELLNELAQRLPMLQVGQKNHPLDLIGPLLCWLNDCGVQTAAARKDIGRCRNCDYFSDITTGLGNIYFLNLPLSQSHGSGGQSSGGNVAVVPEKCMDCGLQLAGMTYFTCPDVLTVYLPRVSEDGLMHTNEVKPSKVIKILIGKERLSYKLTSVICQNNRGDDRVFSCFVQTLREIDCHGIIFIYEKFSEKKCCKKAETETDSGACAQKEDPETVQPDSSADSSHL